LHNHNQQSTPAYVMEKSGNVATKGTNYSWVNQSSWRSQNSSKDNYSSASHLQIHQYQHQGHPSMGMSQKKCIERCRI
jgi:hypothetical protein